MILSFVPCGELDWYDHIECDTSMPAGCLHTYYELRHTDRLLLGLDTRKLGMGKDDREVSDGFAAPWWNAIARATSVLHTVMLPD